MKMITPDFKGNNKGHYSAAVESKGMLYISGQLSIDPDTRKVPEGGIKEHAKLAFNNLKRVLEAAGLTTNDVVQCHLYVAGIENWDAVNEEYIQFFGEHKPAHIVVSVEQLHFGCLVEIEAVSECHEDNTQSA